MAYFIMKIQDLSIVKEKSVEMNTIGLESEGGEEEMMMSASESSIVHDGSGRKRSDSINVKFLVEELHNFASAFPKKLTINNLKERISDVLEIDKDMIKLLNENEELMGSVLLEDLIVEPETMKIKLESTSGDSSTIKQKVRENIPSVDVITVHLSDHATSEVKDLVVTIEDKYCQKEWLGGYRNKVSGIEYHNAYTQTTRRLWNVYDHSQRVPAPILYHRDTQTSYPPKNIAVATAVSRGTQMWRSDHYIPTDTDKILTATPYQPYNMVKSYEREIVVIQRSVKNWLKGRFSKIVELKRKHFPEQKKVHVKIKMVQDFKERNILTSAVYPTTRDDFYVLYFTVDKWLKRELNRISNHQTEVSIKSGNYFLLLEEIKLLYAIEKQRIKAKNESLKKQEIRFLDKTSRPKTFKNSKGQITSVDDEDTQRAREFREIYSRLIRRDITPSNRIDFLIVFKQLFTSKFENYEYASDLISLVDREINMITIGSRNKDMVGLHKRIEQLYLHFLRQEEFNPKSAKYKKPNWPKTVDKLYQCKRCFKLLPPSKFPVHVRMKSYQECTSCEWIHNIAHNRADMSPYLKLLRKVQRGEMKRCCYSSVCFVLQQIGMGYLTNVIWHGMSAISECTDMTKLQHVRWLPDIEWAPWNTILLTDQEAKCHRSLTDVFSFYSKSFVEKVKQRHMMARLHFVDLLKMDHYLRTTGVWQNIKDSGPYFHPSHAKAFATENEINEI